MRPLGRLIEVLRTVNPAVVPWAPTLHWAAEELVYQPTRPDPALVIKLGSLLLIEGPSAHIVELVREALAYFGRPA